MKLYHHPASPNARAVRVAARLQGLEVEELRVDASGGEQRSPAYLALNPNGLFPTLVDGDFVLWETVAILQYLAEQVGPGGLLPAGSRCRADVLRWQAWALAHWHPCLRVFVFEHVFKAVKGGGKPDPRLTAAQEPAFHRLTAILDAHLARGPWLAGDRLSVADLFVGAFLMYADVARLPLQPYAHVRRWYGRIDALPAWKATEPVW